MTELTCRASVGKYEEVDTKKGVRRKRKEEKTRSNEQELHPLCTRPMKGKEKRYSRWEENAEPDEMQTMKIVKMLMKYKTGNRGENVFFSSKVFCLLTGAVEPKRSSEEGM